MSRKYCMTFNICYHTNIEKIKIDYGFVPAKFENNHWISEVSNEILDKFEASLKPKKIKDDLIFFFKKKNQVYFRIITSGFDDMEKAEFPLLKKSVKLIKSKIPFRFNYKKELSKRFKRILNNN